MMLLITLGENRKRMHVTSLRVSLQSSVNLLQNKSTYIFSYICIHMFEQCAYIHIFEKCIYVYIYVLTYQNLETSWRYSGYISAFKCRDAGSVPVWETKIPHAVGALSLCATTREPVCCNYWGPHALEPMLHNKRRPCAVTREKPPGTTRKNQCSQK